MIRIFYICLLCATVLSAGAATHGVEAAAEREVPNASADAAQLLPTNGGNGVVVASGISASTAAQIARSSVGGTVLSVNRRGNRFQVKIQKPGKIVKVLIDAATGGIIGIVGQ